jgi:hypothetical protein
VGFSPASVEGAWLSDGEEQGGALGAALHVLAVAVALVFEEQGGVVVVRASANQVCDGGEHGASGQGMMAWHRAEADDIIATVPAAFNEEEPS